MGVKVQQISQRAALCTLREAGSLPPQGSAPPLLPRHCQCGVAPAHESARPVLCYSLWCWQAASALTWVLGAGFPLCCNPYEPHFHPQWHPSYGALFWLSYRKVATAADVASPVLLHQCWHYETVKGRDDDREQRCELGDADEGRNLQIGHICWKFFAKVLSIRAVP